MYIQSKVMNWNSSPTSIPLYMILFRVKVKLLRCYSTWPDKSPYNICKSFISLAAIFQVEDTYIPPDLLPNLTSIYICVEVGYSFFLILETFQGNLFCDSLIWRKFQKIVSLLQNLASCSSEFVFCRRPWRPNMFQNWSSGPNNLTKEDRIW